MLKPLLVVALSCLAFAGHGQTLPIDSTSGKVVYRGVVNVPGATSEQLFRRARAYAHVATQSPLIEDATQVVSGAAERPVGSRVLRYEVYIKVQPGGYRYELSDFQNKTGGVRYAAAPGVTATAPGGQAPLERVLANPDGYRKGKPTAALTAYTKQVAAAAEQAVRDLQQGMR